MHELDGRLAHVQVDALAHVRDVDDVGPLAGHALEQPDEVAGPVGQPREEHEPAARLGLVAAGDRGEQAGVDVAAGEDRDRRARRGAARTWPPSSAATPTAPAPSTTSFARSISTTIASAVSSSPTTTTSSRPALEQRQRDLAGALDRDAVGDRQRRGRRAPARRARSDSGYGAQAATCTPTTSTSGRADLTAIATPRAEAAAADRHDDLGEVRHVLEQLEPERALARHDVGSSNGCTNASPPSSRARERGLDALVDGLAADVDLRPHAARASTLASGASLGTNTSQCTPRWRAAAASAWRVVAGRGGDDAAAAAVLPQRGELGRHAAHLERAGALQVLRLQRDDAARALGERARREHRRAPGELLDRGTGRLDVGGRDRGLSPGGR